MVKSGGKKEKKRESIVLHAGGNAKRQKGVLNSADLHKQRKKRIVKSMEKKRDKKKEELRAMDAKVKESAAAKRKRPTPSGPLPLAPGLVAAKRNQLSVKSKAVKSEEEEQEPTSFKKRKMEKEKEGQKGEKDDRLTLIKKAKVLWEKARENSLPQNEKRPIVNELFGLLKGRFCEIILKHDASRIVQTVFKNGTTEQRAEIVKEIRPSFMAIIKSTYGSFLIKAIFTVGSTQLRKEIFEKDLRTHFNELVLHINAFRAIETFFELAQKRERSLILDEFYDREYIALKPQNPVKLEDLLEQSPEKRAIVLGNIKKFIEKFINKVSETTDDGPSALSPKKIGLLGLNLLHQLIYDYLSHCNEQERTDMIGLVGEFMVHMLHTRAGHRIGCICIAHGSAASRKVIMKTMRGLSVSAATETMGHRTVLCLLNFVDDTKLQNKLFLSELNDNIKDVISDQFGYLVYIAALSGRNSPFYGPYNTSLLKPVTYTRDGEQVLTSLKSEEQKIRELTGFCNEALMGYFLNNTEDLLYSPHAISVLEVFMQQASVEERLQIHQAIAEVAPTEKAEELTFLEEMKPSRVIRKLITTSDESSDETKFASLLLSKMETNLGMWATQKGSSFIVVSLLESPTTQQKVKAILNPSKKSLKASKEPGAKILLEHLQAKVIEKKAREISKK